MEDISAYSAFPQAFKSAPAGLKNIAKFLLVNRPMKYSNPEAGDDELETIFVADRLLIDLSELNAPDIDLSILKNDCRYIESIIDSCPDELRSVVGAFNPKSNTKEVVKALETAKKIGLTEDDAVRAGGGLLFTAIVVAIAVAGAVTQSGCVSKAKIDTTMPKQKPKPDADAGPDGGSSPE